MNKNKKFDAVKMMRDIRKKLSEKYWKHPDIFEKRNGSNKEKVQYQSQDISRPIKLDTSWR